MATDGQDERPHHDKGALSGRTALVTGAGRGIGRATARRLAADGALVVVHYAGNEEAARETVERIIKDGGQALPLRTELGTDDAAVPALYERFDAALAQLGAPPRLDILVNNAGISVPGSIYEVSPRDVDRLLELHAKAPLFLVQHGLPRMGSGGRIINISSAATRVAFPQSLAYSMAKGALEVMTRALAKELGERGITVNAVAPGFVKTDMNTRRWATAEAEAAHAAHAALGRMGLPDDVADIVAFLASDDARWITGQCLDASGGSHL
ncbi:SDR family NAD(P)-dependent oxidoreductase [Streptomyces sp. 8N114]|uniref:SDR family NAD(P)-dependent oxidoreductase n=1 Tax=Streptomyces sp. 8N114 TaxID=3457419 RepID=UPI003FD32987